MIKWYIYSLTLITIRVHGRRVFPRFSQISREMRSTNSAIESLGSIVQDTNIISTSWLPNSYILVTGSTRPYLSAMVSLPINIQTMTSQPDLCIVPEET